MMTLSLTEGSAVVMLAGASATMRAMLSSAEYGSLPDEEKPHLKARLEMMLRIDEAPKKQPAIATEATRLHVGERYSEGAIRKCYYDKWIAGGRSWQALINRARVPDDTAGLEPAMVLLWHEVFFQKMGRGRAAHRELERLWRAGRPFPGFGDRNRTKHLPPSLSYSNLMRGKYKPTPVVKRVARIGVGAAHDLLPGVLQTRVGMRPGSFLLFDDIWHDLNCSVPGQMGMRRVLQFHCLELLSGYHNGRGMKPEILGSDGRMERLKEREMLFLFAHVLGSRGYNPEGCLCVMELGTATVPERVVRLLHDFSGGALRIEKGTTRNNPIADGLYAGRPKGNFKLKAALESIGNLIHNETGDRLLLPAQTGNFARLNEPEDLHGRKAHLEQLQKAALLVPSHLRELVTANITPPFAQVAQLLDLMQERINDFEEHALEGWEQCGFLVPIYRLSEQEDWRRQDGLTPEMRAALAPLLAANPKLTSCRRMTRREVYEERVKPHLVTLPPHLIPELLGMELATERRVGKDGRFHFEDAELLGEEQHFEGVAVDGNGTETVLKDGETYATFVSMLDSQYMHVCDAKGRYLGKAERTIVPTRGDAEAYARACGQRTKSARQRLVPVLRAAAPIIRRDAEAAEQATEVLAQIGRVAERVANDSREGAIEYLANQTPVTDDPDA